MLKRSFILHDKRAAMSANGKFDQRPMLRFASMAGLLAARRRKVYADAAFLALRARAAQNHNDWLGLSAAVLCAQNE